MSLRPLTSPHVHICQRLGFHVENAASDSTLYTLKRRHLLEQTLVKRSETVHYLKDQEEAAKAMLYAMEAEKNVVKRDYDDLKRSRDPLGMERGRVEKQLFDIIHKHVQEDEEDEEGIDLPAGTHLNVLHVFHHLNEVVSIIKFAPVLSTNSKATLAIGFKSGKVVVRCWSMEGFERGENKKLVIDAHERSISCLTWSGDGQYFLTTSLDHLCKVWKLSTTSNNTVITCLQTFSPATRSSLFTCGHFLKSSPPLIVVGLQNGYVKVLDPSSGNRLQNINLRSIITSIIVHNDVYISTISGALWKFTPDLSSPILTQKQVFICTLLSSRHCIFLNNLILVASLPMPSYGE